MSARPGVPPLAHLAIAVVVVSLAGAAAGQPAEPARIQIDGNGRVALSGTLVVFGRVSGSGEVTAAVDHGWGLVAIGGRVFRLTSARPRVTARLTGPLYAEGRRMRLRVVDAIGLSLSVSAVGQAVLVGRGTYRLDTGRLTGWPARGGRVPIGAVGALPAAPAGRRVAAGAVRHRKSGRAPAPARSVSLPSGR